MSIKERAFWVSDKYLAYTVEAGPFGKSVLTIALASFGSFHLFGWFLFLDSPSLKSFLAAYWEPIIITLPIQLLHVSLFALWIRSEGTS